MFRKVKGFTLIELLIVVAIIAILAAIAVPNFLEAQVRSKVSRGKADMRSMATAMEAYRMDFTGYPPDHAYYWFFSTQIHPPLTDPKPLLAPLTTPVAYMTSIPNNVFPSRSFNQMGQDAEKYYVYSGKEWKANMIMFDPATYKETGKVWSIVSVGPDRKGSSGEYLVFGEDVVNKAKVNATTKSWNITDGAIYDATNGTMSEGDVVRVGP